MPATLVMTEPFQGLAASFGATLGAPAYPCVAVPHPVSTKDDATLDTLADHVLDQVVLRLTGE